MMFSVDVGGTFTDVVDVSGSEIRTVEVSTNYSGPEFRGHPQAPQDRHRGNKGHRDTQDHGKVFRPTRARRDPNWRREFGVGVRRPLFERYLRGTMHEPIRADGSVLFDLDEARRV